MQEVVTQQLAVTGDGGGLTREASMLFERGMGRGERRGWWDPPFGQRFWLARFGERGGKFGQRFGLASHMENL